MFFCVRHSGSFKATCKEDTGPMWSNWKSKCIDSNYLGKESNLRSILRRGYKECWLHIAVSGMALVMIL